MNLPPPFQQFDLRCGHDVHRPANVRFAHSVSPHETRRLANRHEIDLRLARAEYVNMRGLMIVDENDDPETALPENRDHDNPTG